MPAFGSDDWKWENAAAGAVAGFATVAALHPLDVVRTRFQVSDGRVSNLPVYKNTGHAIYTIARMEGLRGLYAGFYPAVLGSTISWGLYFFFYSRAKHRYLKGYDEQLSPGYHLVSAAEAGALMSAFCGELCTSLLLLLASFTGMLVDKSYLACQNKIAAPNTLLSEPTLFWVFWSDALRTILKEEGWRALYKGIGPGLLLVTHGAVQFTVYEELRKVAVRFKGTEERTCRKDGGDLLNSFDYAMLGASSKLAAIFFTYPYQVIRARLQQRPSSDGIPKYSDSWHVVKETARYEGVRGFYRGITSNLLKNVPAASITFVVYENVLRLLKLSSRHN